MFEFIIIIWYDNWSWNTNEAYVYYRILNRRYYQHNKIILYSFIYKKLQARNKIFIQPFHKNHLYAAMKQILHWRIHFTHFIMALPRLIPLLCIKELSATINFFPLLPWHFDDFPSYFTFCKAIIFPLLNAALC